MREWVELKVEKNKYKSCQVAATLFPMKLKYVEPRVFSKLRRFHGKVVLKDLTASFCSGVRIGILRMRLFQFSW